MARMCEMRTKEVINIKDGCRLGYVCDIIFCEDTGEIEKIIIPGPAKMFGVLFREDEYRVPWECIKQIGADIILIDVDIKKDKILCPCD